MIEANPSVKISSDKFVQRDASKASPQAPKGAWTQDKHRGAEAVSAIDALRSGIAQVQQIWPAAAGALAQHIFMSPKRRSPKPQSWKQKDPPVVTGIALGQLKIQTYAWGSAPWVLLVHGWDSNAASMSKFIDPIRERGFGVVTFDGPAHGDSEGELTTMGGFAAVCDELYGVYGEFGAIIGHSIGGPAAVMALENHHSLHPRFVFISAPCRSDTAVTLFSKSFGLNQATDLNLRMRLSREVGRPIEHISFEQMNASFRNTVLLVHDENDGVIPISEAEQSLRVLPQATLRRTRGLGHDRILADTDVVAAVTEFATKPSANL